MIEFEITESIDSEIIQKYSLCKRIIKVGRSSINDICVNDSTCSDVHFRFIQTHCSIIIDIKSKTNSTSINNKKITGILTLKKNDLIAFGTTTIKILDFTPQKITHRNDTVHEKCQQIFEEDELLANILTETKNRLNMIQGI